CSSLIFKTHGLIAATASGSVSIHSRSCTAARNSIPCLTLSPPDGRCIRTTNAIVTSSIIWWPLRLFKSGLEHARWINGCSSFAVCLTRRLRGVDILHPRTKILLDCLSTLFDVLPKLMLHRCIKTTNTSIVCLTWTHIVENIHLQ